MHQHIQERILDKISEGELPADELPSFWIWLKRGFKNPSQPNNTPYLCIMRRTLFDACKEFSQYHSFFLTNLANYDAIYLKKQWEYEDQVSSYELAQDLIEICNTWKIQNDLQNYLQDLIKILIRENEK